MTKDSWQSGGRLVAAPWVVSLGVLTAAAGSAVAATGPDFAREVRPILSNRCFKCHGPDEERREAGLRLDLPEEAARELDSGARAVVAGRPDESELVARILSSDPDLVMPPPHTKVTLSDGEKRILTEWIAAGAVSTPHWAFVPPESPPLPSVGPNNWPRNQIDRFVLARLEAEGLAPAAEADRATLCRRVHLDLIGLPPTPEELDAFLADESSDAFERLVDRLLESPRYGERWARRWLDLARYADTNGYEKDRERSIWPWRDWVIRALNDDMPFDLFTLRQIAGDLLPDASADDVLATGFHRNTMLNEEGGIDPLEFRYLAVVDRVGTTGTVWLGLTTACAQCHTHKYDPLTHTDYFGLFALLNNCDEPEWTIPGPAEEARVAAIRAELDSLWERLPAAWPVAPPPQQLAAGSDAPPPETTADPEATLEARLDAWERTESARAVDWQVARPMAMRSSMPHLVARPDGSVLASGDLTKSDVYTIELTPSEMPVRAVRLEVLPDESLPAHGPGLCGYEGPKGDFFLSEIEFATAEGRVPVAGASDSFSGSPFAGQQKATATLSIDGDMSSGWTTNGDQGRPHAAVYQLAEPVPPGVPLTVTLRFERHFACPLGCFRLSVADVDQAEARGLTAAEEAALCRPAEARSAEQQRALFRRFLMTAPELAEPTVRIRRLEDSLRAGTTTLVLQERPADNPRPTFLHHRGEFTQPTREVAPAVPAFLPPLPAGARPDRLALARWLIAPDHPLTARVTVNRHWQAFFGRGIVATLEDFGYQSDPPTHPELLDWLAVAFVTDPAAGGLGWSQKKLHRLIATSATYRQASNVTPELAARDPHNTLLARGPRVRLEAEVIRDSVLASAGLLSTKMYGPGVRPPQPEGVTEVAYGAPKWPVSEGEDRHRRSIYTFQKRTAPFAMVTTFDGPTGEACVPRREVSNSPLQALTLLNDPMFLEAAQALGRSLAARDLDDAGRLRELARRTLGRAFDPEEAAVLEDFIRRQRARLAAAELDPGALAGDVGSDAAERAVWTLVARAVLNLDEMIVKR